MSTHQLSGAAPVTSARLKHASAIQDEAASVGAQLPPTSARHADEETSCPACSATMRLWANYHRCGTCGYKESCCF